MTSKFQLQKNQATTSTSVTTAAETSHGEAENGSASAQGSLFAIESVKAAGSDKKATLFFNNGSNTTYIPHRAARRLGANKLSGSQALQVLSLGGVTKQYANPTKYQLNLETTHQRIVSIIAYGMDVITSPVTLLDMSVIQKLFS